jgi:shikimate dehydrogenase
MGVGPISLIVNATSAGMAPNIDQNPWPEEIQLPHAAVVYDLVYRPQETALVRMARRQGLEAMTGGGMLVEQAALSFERWTGQVPPRKEMQQALVKELNIR